MREVVFVSSGVVAGLRMTDSPFVIPSIARNPSRAQNTSRQVLQISATFDARSQDGSFVSLRMTKWWVFYI